AAGSSPERRRDCPVRYIRSASCLAISDEGLDLAEIRDAPIGIFPSVAGLLIAAEGGEGVPVGAVQADLPGAQAATDGAGLLRRALHIGGEAVDRFIGHLHRL